MGYITDLDACTDPITGDYLLIADASASAGNRDRKVDVSEFALTERENTFTSTQTILTVRSGVTGIVVDNGVYSFSPGHTYGIIIISPNGYNGMASYSGVLTYDVSTPACTALSVGANLNVTTGALTGTTGADAKVTISAHSDGKIYIENRRGFSANWNYLII